MELKVHRPAKQKTNRRRAALEVRIRQQITDAECLLSALDDYCRENPHDEPCVANDPAWREQIMRQLEELHAMLVDLKE